MMTAGVGLLLRKVALERPTELMKYNTIEKVVMEVGCVGEEMV